MNRSTIYSALFVFLLAAVPAALAGQEGPGVIPSEQPSVEAVTDQVTARLYADHYQLVPGETLSVGVELEIKKGWHVYWKNPGDLGRALELTLHAPADYAVSPFLWPVPKRIPERNGIMVNGYKGTVFFETTVQIPPGTQPDTEIALTLDAEWLVCEESCVRGGKKGLLELKLSTVDPEYAESSPDAWKTRFTQAESKRAQAPGPDLRLTTALDTPALEVGKRSRFTVFVTPTNDTPLTTAEGKFEHALFLEPAPGVIERGRPRVTLTDGKLRIVQELEGHNTLVTGDPIPLNGIVQVRRDGKRIDLALTASLPTVATEATMAAAETATERLADDTTQADEAALPTPEDNREQLPLWSLILFGLVGGLILNIMPCVLPVLSLKALKVVETTKKSPGVARANAVAYLMGILMSFWVLAGTLSAAQYFGQKVGWGFQMQNPGFITFLCAVVFAFALSLLGVFDIPGVSVSGSTDSSSLKGSFVEGILTTLLSTPCSAPYLGGAIAYALSQPISWIFFTFSLVGVGLALPMVLITITPAFQRFIPKPGAWMDTFKHIVGLLLVATTVWLLSILTTQTDASGVVGVVALLTSVAIGGWILGTFSSPLHPPLRRAMTFVVAGFVAALGLFFIDFSGQAGETVSLESAHGIEWRAFEGAETINLANEGHTVFLDFTASWCVTCKVNEENAIETEDVARLLANNNVVSVKADWSNYDEDIKAWINHFGKDAIPLYVIIPAGDVDDPIVLDEIITQGELLEALEKAGPSDKDAKSLDPGDEEPSPEATTPLAVAGPTPPPLTDAQFRAVQEQLIAQAQGDYKTLMTQLIDGHALPDPMPLPPPLYTSMLLPEVLTQQQISPQAWQDYILQHPDAARAASEELSRGALEAYVATSRQLVGQLVEETTSPTSLIEWRPFEGKTSLDFADQGHTVFINFTASWCVTCKVNEERAIETRAVAERIAELRVVPVEADWTRYDEDIKKWINHFGKDAIPLYVILPANKAQDPIILSEVLTEAQLLEALALAGPSAANAPSLPAPSAHVPVRIAIQGPIEGENSTAETASAQHPQDAPATAGHGGIAWRTDYDAAIAEAKAAGKPVLIDFTAEWCEPCQRLNTNTFSKPEVHKAMERFVAIQIDDTEGLDENVPIMQKHGVINLPHIAFISPDGTVLDNPRIIEFVEAPAFLEVLETVK